MFPGGLVGRDRNVKFMADNNFRRPFLDNSITTVPDLWNFIDSNILNSVHPEPIKYNGDYLTFSEKQYASDRVNYR